MDVVKEIYAPSQRYKASIFERSDGSWEVRAYRSLTSTSAASDCCWEQLADNSITDSYSAAENVAVGWLGRVSGEEIDLTPEPITVEWARDYSRCSTAEFVEPNESRVEYLGAELCVRRILRLDDLFFVEEVTQPGKWWIGQQSGDGVIRCWGCYGLLKNAIDGR